MATKAKKTKKDDKPVEDSFDALVETSLQNYQFLKPGQIVEGVVTDKSANAIIVDVGAKSEGIITGKDLKTDLIDVGKIKVGEKILVYVITPESREGSLLLSLRRTEEMRVWLDLDKAKRNNENVKATVVEANTGGVIVDLIAGVRGFIPTSQLDPSRIYEDGKRISGKDISTIIQKKLSRLLGQELEAQIIELDQEKGRVILSEKRSIMEAELMESGLSLSEIKPDDILDGKITAITPFGVFVNAGGIEGLVHLSELSWDKVTDVSDLYRVGDEVQVKVLQVSDGGKRVAYSIKQLTDDPWMEMIKKYKVDDVVEGEVERVVDYGAFVRIDKGINGLIHISELSDKLVRNPRDIVTQGENVKVKILSISENERHLGLSLKRA